MKRNSDTRSDTRGAAGDGGFWSRWSRRKIDAKAAPADADMLDRPREPAPTEKPPDATIPPDLPDIGTLDKTSDFAVFMSRGVPDAIRNRALRRLWQLDPALANLDGMNDYDEDFTQAGRAIDQIRTAYRVGRGMMNELPRADAPSAGASSSPESREGEEEA